MPQPHSELPLDGIDVGAVSERIYALAHLQPPPYQRLLTLLLLRAGRPLPIQEAAAEAQAAGARESTAVLANSFRKISTSNLPIVEDADGRYRLDKLAPELQLLRKELGLDEPEPVPAQPTKRMLLRPVWLKRKLWVLGGIEAQDGAEPWFLASDELHKAPQYLRGMGALVAPEPEHLLAALNLSSQSYKLINLSRGTSGYLDLAAAVAQVTRPKRRWLDDTELTALGKAAPDLLKQHVQRDVLALLHMYRYGVLHRSVAIDNDATQWRAVDWLLPEDICLRELLDWCRRSKAKLEAVTRKSPEITSPWENAIHSLVQGDGAKFEFDNKDLEDLTFIQAARALDERGLERLRTGPLLPERPVFSARHQLRALSAQ